MPSGEGLLSEGGRLALHTRPEARLQRREPKGKARLSARLEGGTPSLQGP